MHCRNALNALLWCCIARSEILHPSPTLQRLGDLGHGNREHVRQSASRVYENSSFRYTKPLHCMCARETLPKGCKWSECRIARRVPADPSGSRILAGRSCEIPSWWTPLNNYTNTARDLFRITHQVSQRHGRPRNNVNPECL